MRNFIGRHDYLSQLEDDWKTGETRLVAVYGRRRVGKTELIRVFSNEKQALIFEALEGEDTRSQIKHFLYQLSRFLGEPYLADLAYDNWFPVFTLLTQKIQAKRHLVLCFDELSWMAVGRTKLVAQLKFFWDNHWKQHPHLFFILCGSVASWMIRHVVRSKALYGRISSQILLKPLKPNEVAEYVGRKRGYREILEYLLVFGGIPKYLEELDFNRSVQLNIEKTCLRKSGFFFEEADKIFYNQFKEVQNYKQIVHLLIQHPLNLKAISQKLHMASSGGLKVYLDNLMAAELVDKATEITANFRGKKTFHYFVVDEFLRFHAHFIRPYQQEIQQAERVSFAKIAANRWFPFMGLAFEKFCIKHRYRIGQILGMADKTTACSPVLFQKKDGYQFDLVFLRSDATVTLCEIKYLGDRPSTKIIGEFDKKIKKINLKGKTLERVLITNLSPSPSLAESGYFHHILTAEEIIFSKL